MVSFPYEVTYLSSVQAFIEKVNYVEDVSMVLHRGFCHNYDHECAACSDGAAYKRLSFYDGTVEYFGSGHLPFAVLAVLVLTIIVILPLILTL